EDMEGHLAWTDDFISSCPNVIAPGEKGWFYNSIGASGAGDLDSSAEYQFVPALKIVRSNADPVFYEVSDTSLSTNALGYPAVTGRVRNTTGKADQLVNLHAVFYGNDGKVIGISGMTMMDLGPDEQRSFEITGLDLSSSVREEVISDYKVIASKAHFQV
ncbi:MAG: FxLYD domain-containing protein, partial [Eubacteriales bacterium]